MIKVDNYELNIQAIFTHKIFSRAGSARLISLHNELCCNFIILLGEPHDSIMDLS